jgi:peptide/nickel transport system permease protein
MPDLKGSDEPAFGAAASALHPMVSIVLSPPAARKRRHLPPVSIQAPAIVLILLVILCYLGPTIFGLAGPNAGTLADALLPPLSAHHILGTDPLGNDLLSRALHGGQISIEIGLGTVALGIILGGLVGMIAGYTGGIQDSVIMRALDILIAFPPLVLALVVSSYLGPSEGDVIIAIAFLTVPSFARLTRSEVLRIRQLDFITASEMTGGSTVWRMSRHVIPNIAPPVLSYGVLMIAVVMVVEAGLDFLGLGVRPPAPTWGDMIAQGQSYMNTDWWVIGIPAGFLLVAVGSLNLLGQAARTKWEAR